MNLRKSGKALNHNTGKLKYAVHEFLVSQIF